MNKMSDKGTRVFNYIGYIYVSLVAIICIMPFWLVISGSFTKESEIIHEGFKIIPKVFSFEAYKYIFVFPDRILRAYGVSIFITVTGTLIGLFFISMAAYVLVRKDFKYSNGFSFFFYFTTLFNGGLVPYYLLIVNHLQLKNTIYALLLPSLMNAWLLLLMRNFMKSIPESIIESAKIDGAGEFTIYSKFVLPLAKPGLATIGLFLALAYWNDWFLALMFVEEPKLHPLQYMLYKVVQSIEGLRSASSRGGLTSLVELPSESLKMATAVVVTGPIVFLYPFVQRYFIKGLIVGSVKG